MNNKLSTLAQLIAVVVLFNFFNDIILAKNTRKEEYHHNKTYQNDEMEDQKSHHSKPWSRPYGLAGCGLGSMVVGKKGGQIFAATTNGTSDSQIFGITSGTSNCLEDPNNEVAMNVDKFLQGNQSAVVSDAAQGKGETIRVIASMLHCSNHHKEIGRVIQNNYTKIFSRENSEINLITDAIINSILASKNLAKSCRLES